jgi:hypothetical protein
MTISKIFTQKYISNDCEARDWEWVDTNKSYEELAQELATKWDGWFSAVRVVEKTFDAETFKITIKVIKRTGRTYTNYRWDGGVVETFGE